MTHEQRRVGDDTIWIDNGPVTTQAEVIANLPLEQRIRVNRATREVYVV